MQNDSCLLKSICTPHFKTHGLCKLPSLPLALVLRSAFSDTTLSVHAAQERLAFYKLSQVSQPVLPSSYRLRYRLSLLLLVILSAG